MKSCLIVDDSKVIRKVARHILEMVFHRDVAIAGPSRLTGTRVEDASAAVLDQMAQVVRERFALDVARLIGLELAVAERKGVYARSVFGLA